jgi:hypothetical protein
MRKGSIILFLLIVVYGIGRYLFSGESASRQAQTKIETLSSVQERLYSLDSHASSPIGKQLDEHISTKKQEAQQVQQSALPSVNIVKGIQIFLTALTALLTCVVI